MNRRGFLSSIAALVAGGALAREVKPPANVKFLGVDAGGREYTGIIADIPTGLAGIARATYPDWSAVTDSRTKPLSMEDIVRLRERIESSSYREPTWADFSIYRKRS